MSKVSAFFSGSCSFHGFFITEDEKVFSFGLNQNGQLGVGDETNRNKPTEVEFFKDIPLSFISCGYSHSLFLTRLNQVFGVGANNWGNFGGGLKKFLSSTPTSINSDVNSTIFSKFKIIKISCGGFHSFFINEKFEIYGAGFNGDGELGCGDKKKKFTPVKINFHEKIEEAHCGFSSSVFLTKSKKVFVCGSFEGINNRTIQTTPILISSFLNKKIIQISCGVDHCLYMDEKRNVYSSGRNKEGQLGINNKISQSKPILISSLSDKKIKRIKCGGHFSLFSTKDNQLYGCGKSTTGELGMGENKIYESVILLNYYEKKQFFDFETSWDGSYFLSNNNNDIYGCGSNKYGSLFNSQIKNSLNLQFLSNKFKVKRMNFFNGTNHRRKKFIVKFSSNTSLLENNKFCFIFPNKQNQFIYCRYAVQSPIIKELIKKKSFSINLEDEEYDSFQIIKNGLLEIFQ